MTDTYLYTKIWRIERARGLTRLVDATTSRRHLQMLQDNGWTIRGIAEAIEVPAPMLRRVVTGAQPRIKRIWAERLLQFIGDELPTHETRTEHGPMVSSIGSIRRVQALLALGWPHEEQRARSGVHTDSVLNRPGPHVSRRTHDRIAAMYAELLTVPGPSNRTRLDAARRGYLSPIFWGDVDRDPEPILDESEVC